MVDLKKEIKLSDLVPRRKSKPRCERSRRAQVAARRPKRELVGLKVGASQIAAARVMNNGSANLLQRCTRPARARRRRRRRGARRAGAGACARPASSRSTSFRAAESGSGSRRTGSACAPSTSTGSPTSGSSLTRSAFGRTRLCRSRSTRRCSTTTSSARPSTTRAPSRGASFWPPPTASRSIATSRRLARRTSSCTGSISRHLRSSVQWAPQTSLRSTRPSAPSSRSRSDTTARRSPSAEGEVCEFTRVLEWGGGKLETAISFDLGVTPEEASELKLAASLEERCRERRARIRACRPCRRRSGGSWRSWRGSSSPRSSSTRARPGRSRSPRSSSRVERAGCRAFPRSSSV